MFNTKPAITAQFNSWDELQDWTQSEAQNTTRIPTLGLLEAGARFHDDEYFGNDDYRISLTQQGLKTICSRIGFPYHALDMISEEGLASALLNDLFKQDAIKEQLHNSQLVVNTTGCAAGEAIACGLVSQSYAGYSNQTFLNDIVTTIGDNPSANNGELEFKEAFSINTKLHLRMLSEHTKGIVTGTGGTKEDVTRIGVEFTNSMIGNSAVSLSFFLHRLVCANGLILPAGSASAKVIHQGKTRGFCERLNKAFQYVFASLGEKSKYIKTLSEIDFSPEKIVKLKLTDTVFDIIPRSKSTILNEYPSRFKPYRSKKLEGNQRKEYECLALKLLPKEFAGPDSGVVFNSPYRDNASMFDLINVFTEYAKGVDHALRADIQRKAGNLADWICNNEKSFS